MASDEITQTPGNKSPFTYTEVGRNGEYPLRSHRFNTVVPTPEVKEEEEEKGRKDIAFLNCAGSYVETLRHNVFETMGKQDRRLFPISNLRCEKYHTVC